MYNIFPSIFLIRLLIVEIYCFCKENIIHQDFTVLLKTNTSIASLINNLLKYNAMCTEYRT